MTVSEIASDDGAWQDYVQRCPRASLYHSLEWRDILRKSFHHRPRYLMARGDAGAVGVLPLVEMRSAIFGHFLVSLPFVNYGGILADTSEAERELAGAAVALAVREGASHIELRQTGPFIESIEGWTLREHKAALVIRLAGNSAALWDGLSSRLRGKVRKAEKNGAAFVVGCGELLREFYFLYALNMRDLGTPVYGRAFFENVLASSEGARILLVRRGDQPAAAALAVREQERIQLPWICQNYGESGSNVNEFLYWNAIEWACGEGAAELDLGRSTIGAGTYRFKLQWNPEVRGLYWYYWTVPGKPLPELNPNNPKYQFAVECWKKLPLGIANRLGPWIVRNIP